MSRRTTAICLTLICLLAFAARLGTSIHLKAWQSPNAMEHRSIAASLAAGRGFTFADWRYYGPTSVQSPPFPFLLAGLFKAFGVVSVDANNGLALDPAGAAKAYTVVLVLNALAGAGMVWLTYAGARTLGATPTAGLIAAALVAVWPTQVYAARVVQAISLITCGLMGMTILYYRAVRTGSAGAWTGYAVVATLAALTEPVFLPALVASGALMLATRTLTWPQRGRNVAILAFAVAALIGPWAARNYVVHGKLIPVKGSFWVNVWKGNNDFATGTDRPALTPAQAAKVKRDISAGKGDEVDDPYRQYDLLDLSQKAALSNRPEAYREELFKGYAVTWIKAHPGGYLRLCGVRLLKTLTIDWDNPRSLYTSYLVARGAVLLMTLAGLVVAWRQRWSLLYPTLVACCALATYTLTVTAARFAFPFEPLQLILGAGAIAALLPKGFTRPAANSPRGFEPMMITAPAR